MHFYFEPLYELSILCDLIFVLSRAITFADARTRVIAAEQFASTFYQQRADATETRAPQGPEGCANSSTLLNFRSLVQLFPFLSKLFRCSAMSVEQLELYSFHWSRISTLYLERFFASLSSNTYAGVDVPLADFYERLARSCEHIFLQSLESCQPRSRYSFADAQITDIDRAVPIGQLFETRRDARKREKGMYM